MPKKSFLLAFVLSALFGVNVFYVRLREEVVHSTSFVLIELRANFLFLFF